MLSCSMETRDVTIMGFPRELSCFLEDLGVEFNDYSACGCDAYVDYGIDGDISYRNGKPIEPIEPDRTAEPEDCAEPITKAVFWLDELEKHKYTIKSYSNGGFMLSVNAIKTDGEVYETYANCKLMYKNIVFVHPLQMPHDSVVCTNLLFDSGNYGFELFSFDCRPCAGNVKVYRVNGNEKYLSREMVVASEERTVWKEYYPNGNVKSIATTSNNPQEIDEDGLVAEPYITNIEYYFEDGQKVSSCGGNSTASSERKQSASHANYQEEEKSSTKWKRFAGESYIASELINNIWQNYAFSFNNSGHGKYIMFGTLPNSHVVTDQMEFEISEVSSDANYLYLHCYELNSPIKIKIRGYSLYTNDGGLRYEKWQ